jgi:hypothetical protein
LDKDLAQVARQTGKRLLQQQALPQQVEQAAGQTVARVELHPPPLVMAG